jgi:hypothetical protein
MTVAARRLTNKDGGGSAVELNILNQNNPAIRMSMFQGNLASKEPGR